jgi:hypothetical protein
MGAIISSPVAWYALEMTIVMTRVRKSFAIILLFIAHPEINIKSIRVFRVCPRPIPRKSEQ